MKTILVVDDEKAVRKSVQQALSGRYFVKTTDTGKRALEICSDSTAVDMVLLDIMMPGMDGLHILEKLHESSPHLPVIMLTASLTLNNAVTAMRSGAADYISKPFDIENLKRLIEKALQTSSLKEKVSHLKQAELPTGKDDYLKKIIGKSEQIKSIHKQIKQVARSDATVLITGESGTGKEMVANAIHHLSRRSQQEIVAINCAALPESLADSELFGHEQGAFTGAVSRRLGCFEAAGGGTLFLDEVGDLSLSIQAKLLRAIQEKEIVRVGSVKPVKVNVRLLAATNSNLEEAVNDGRFRSDLYYRINVVPVVMPALKDRVEDIPLLANHFLEKHGGKNRKKTFSADAINILKKHHWPGNIRELANMVEQVVAMLPDDFITIIDAGMLPVGLTSSVMAGNLKAGVLKGALSLEEAVNEFERGMIEEALIKCNHVQTKTAALLGTSRRILKYKMDQLGVDGNRKYD